MSFNIIPKNCNNILIDFNKISNIKSIYDNENEIYKCKSYYNILKQKEDELFYLSNLEKDKESSLNLSFLKEKIDLLCEIKNLNDYENPIFFDMLEIFSNLSIDFSSEKGESPYRILSLSNEIIGIEQIFKYKIGNNISITHKKIDNDFLNNDSIPNHFVFINLIDFLNEKLPLSTIIIYILFILQLKLKNNGMLIMKLENFKNKLHYEFTYILTNVFEKIWLCKPITNAFHKKEKYLFCRSFNNKKIMFKHIEKINLLENPISSKSIFGETEFLPYYFVNKLNELEVILGQSNLEAIQEIINFYINNNVFEKLETIKRNNLQKCLQILSKHNLPITNNLYKKNNIFLGAEASTQLSTV